MARHDSAAVAANLDAPRTLSVETPHYFFRTLNEDDEIDSLGVWLLDPRAQTNLNTIGQRMKPDELRRYVRGFDRVNAHIFGIFDKESGKLLGIRSAYINRKRSEALTATLIGETGDRGKGAQRETRYPLFQFLFEDLDIRSILCHAVSDHAYMLKHLKELGFQFEGTSFNQRAGAPGLVEIHHYRLSRGNWRNVEAAKARAFVAPYL